MIDEGLNLLYFIQMKPIFYIFLVLIVSINILILLLLGFSIYYLIHIGNQYVENMKQLRIKKKYFFYLLIFMIIFLLIIVLYNFRVILWKIFTPVIWAIIFAYLLNPIVHLIDKRGISRTWSVIVVYISIILVIILISITVTPKIVTETRKLVELLPKYTTEVDNFLNNVYIKIEQLDNFSPQLTTVKNIIRDHLSKTQYYIVETIKEITSEIFNMFSQIVTLVLIPIFTFYFLKDADYFKKKLTFIIPRVLRNELVNIFKDIHVLLNKFIRGQLIVAACVGVLSIIALLIIKVNFAFLIGTIAGISDIIPYFGPVIGAIPAIVVALLDTPTKALWVIIAFIIIQQIESGIITPKIVGESVGLHPVTVILALLIGSEWLGIVGLIFAVPIAASIKIVMKHIIDIIIKT
ncbi:AI-2E family transporter [Crassaminicella thermophila]|nr:AI-2E family transporter [Crassaminicella thermophila]